jgi:hypothetical protein
MNVAPPFAHTHSAFFGAVLFLAFVLVAPVIDHDGNF